MPNRRAMRDPDRPHNAGAHPGVAAATRAHLQAGARLRAGRPLGEHTSNPHLHEHRVGLHTAVTLDRQQ